MTQEVHANAQIYANAGTIQALRGGKVLYAGIAQGRFSVVDKQTRREIELDLALIDDIGRELNRVELDLLAQGIVDPNNPATGG